MIVVTGGAGFIGSNIVRGLNAKGIKDIIVVDCLKQGKKFKNLVGLDIADYIDKNEFIKILHSATFISRISAVFHEGACSDTTEWDGEYMMANNYSFSKALLTVASEHKIPFIYASSAAVYGDNKNFTENETNENPLNVYGYSKWLFDQFVRKHQSLFKSQVVGLRYFNVYGPNEQHKQNMASVAYHFHHQLLATGKVKLFEGCDGYANGEQLRDFIYVEDVVKVNLWLLANKQHSGIFNLGTGKAQSFNDVANAVIKFHGKGEIEYIPFPEKLKGCYQSYTQADMSALRNIGYQDTFSTVEQGVALYLENLV